MTPYRRGCAPRVSRDSGPDHSIEMAITDLVAMRDQKQDAPSRQDYVAGSESSQAEDRPAAEVSSIERTFL